MKRTFILALAIVICCAVPVAAAPDLPDALAQAPASTETAIAVVDAERLNVRAGPDTTYDVIGVVTRGALLAVRAASDDGAWLRVCCVSDQEGWVSAEYVTVHTAPGGQPLVLVTGEMLHVRAGPGTDYDIVADVYHGTELTVTGRNDDGSWWIVCCVADRQGWVAAHLVQPLGDTAGVPASILIPPLYRNIQGFGPLGQEFTPADSALDSLALYTEDFARGNGVGSELRITIHVRAITGPVVGTTSVVLPDSFSGVTRFDFTPALSVLAGVRHVLLIEVVSGDAWGIGSSGTPAYTDGAVILWGERYPEDDLWFVEGGAAR